MDACTASFLVPVQFMEPKIVMPSLGYPKSAISCHAQLSSIINNVVYRLENAPPNAATQALALWRRQIAADWEYLYQVKVAGFETFVIEGNQNDRNEVCTDRDRTGALNRADNWQMLGITAGSTKSHAAASDSGGMGTAHTRKEVCRKLIFAKRLMERCEGKKRTVSTYPAC